MARRFRIAVSRCALVATFLLLAAAGPGHAADEEAVPEKNGKGLQIQLFVENDKWRRTDQHYTNGLKFGLGVERESLPFINTYESVIHELLGRPDQLYYGLFLGQNMYTPRNIGNPSPQPFDRPWAGWTYLGLVSQRVAKGAETSRAHDVLDTLEFDIGTVGPGSGAEDVQIAWHQLIGSPRPQGWVNQIPNEVAFVASYLHKRRYIPAWGDGPVDRTALGFDFIPHAGASLGTVMTHVRAGGIVRYGFNKTGFGPDTIEPGGAMLQGTRDRYGNDGGRKCDWPLLGEFRCEWYVFGGVDMRYVAYNIFLDGTVFRDSPSVDRRPFVYDLLAGLSLRAGAFRLSVTRVTRSEEFTTPRGGGGRQGFHSVSLGVEF